METRLAWYLVSSASFVIPLGVGQLLLPWLLAIYLEESATRIGLAQMIAQLPVVMLVLWGGWLGDRMDQRRLLIYLTGIMTIPPLVLAAIFYWGSVTYALVVVYSVIMGCFMAFVQPARDALVNRVAGQRIQQVVTITVGLQWGVQIIGFAIGSTADFVGPTILLLLISLFMGAAMLAVKLIPPLGEIENETTDGIVSQIKDGLRIAWSNLKIRTAMLQILALAVFFSGAYLVLLPVMIRELYGGGGPEWPRLEGRAFAGSMPEAMEQSYPISENKISGWLWPELTPVLMEEGDVVIALHSLPDTATPNLSGDPRVKVYFRIRRLREDNPYEGDERVG